MGQAFHRKQIPVGSAPRTRGTGIKYVNAVLPTPRVLTAEEKEEREGQRWAETVSEKYRRQRHENIDYVVGIAEKILKQWRTIIDDGDQRLMTFAGWTDASFCPLPVDADVARRYAKEFERVRTQASRELSLDELDHVATVVFRAGRGATANRVLADALKVIRSTAERSAANSSVIQPVFFLGLLQERSAKKQNSALNFVVTQMASMIQKAQERKAA